MKKDVARLVQDRLGLDKLPPSLHPQLEWLEDSLVALAWKVAPFIERHGSVVSLDDLPALLQAPLTNALRVRRREGASEASRWPEPLKRRGLRAA